MIARTEIAKAHAEGNLVVWKQSGVVGGKRSLWMGEIGSNSADPCEDNASVGVIPIDEAFPSGDDGPPYHPNCRCVVIPVLADEMDKLLKNSDDQPRDEAGRFGFKGGTKFTGHKVPTSAQNSNETLDGYNKNGIMKQRRFFDENGNAKLDIDFSHQAKVGAIFPHTHTWKDGKRGGHGELAEQDKELIKDVST